MGEPGNTLEEATESKDKKIALLIAVLALFLALAETGAKKATHHSTAKNIETSDLYNFYQAKKARSTFYETAAKGLEIVAPTIADEKAKESAGKQIAAWKQKVADFEHDPKNPEDSLEKIQERARHTSEERELSNLKLEHYEIAAGAIQIAIVLASAAIITAVPVLAWIAGLLGIGGTVLMAFGYFAPHFLHLG
jgi:hypothetical protein